MKGTATGIVRGIVLLAAALLMHPATAWSLPAPPKLRFVDPTPANGGVVTVTTASVRLDAACSVDPNTLSVSLNSTPIPAGSFLPFTACTDGRMQSQTVSVGLTLPNSAITGGPTSLTAGQSATYTGSASGGGDTLRWNFSGGAAPAIGSSVTPTFEPAGQFTVRLQVTTTEDLSASALDTGNLVTAQRAFNAGDPTPATRAVAVAMLPDVDYENFETGQTHPVRLSAAGDELYAVNTAEARLAIFDVAATDGSLTFSGDVPVGLDPVSAAVRPGTNEVWVVNHLSDSVSVVDAATRTIIATIAVGDEPTDVAFASGRAFVTLAGNQDRVNVYNASTRALLATLPIFGDDPRALAVNAAGTEVYAVVLESGNQTTALFEDLVTSGGGTPPPNPPRAPGLPAEHDVSLIVKFDLASGQWRDETGDNWSNFVDFNLPDSDVFVIDADAGTPSVSRSYSHVGTILFDVAVQPGTGDLWVPNTDARNLVRFEPNLRGHLVESRVTVVDPTQAPNPLVVPPSIDLNPHINYSVTPGSAGEIAASLAHPVTGVFNSSGSTYYVAGLGSQKVGVMNTASGAVTARIPVGPGPSGLALNAANTRLYVLNRFDNTISVVNTATNTESSRIGVAGPARFDPSPDIIKVGRKFLYDGVISSGHGDTACATCHIFGNFDNIAWDLGNPQGTFLPYSQAPWVNFAPLGPSTNGFDPQKGPMTTQTLRGLEGLEPFHWRGDRQDFQAFNQAFIGLMGRSQQLSAGDMDTFTDFIMTVRFPPNPFRNLNDSMPSSIGVPNQNGSATPVAGNPNTGRSLFIGPPALDAGVFTCNQCHLLPTGTTTNLFNGGFEGETQDFKIPHMRNMYEKVGFDVIRPGLVSNPPNANNIAQTDQKKGYGFIHDGAVSLTEFLAASVFTSTTQQERDLFAFMLAFPTETFPCVGSQHTVTSANKNDSSTPGTLVTQAESTRCDLIVKGTIGGVAKGYAYDRASNNFLADSINEAPQSEAALRGSVQPGDLITYMGVPLGAGVRMGIDRDRDTWPDRSEEILGYDPGNPNSNPWE